MKNLIIVSLFLIQLMDNLEQKNDYLKLITSGKWYLEYMEMNEVKQHLPPNIKESNWMIFHKDGKHEVMTMDEIHIGKWEYSKKTNSIKMIEKKNITNQKIEKLTDKKMILSFKQGGNLIKMGLKK